MVTYPGNDTAHWQGVQSRLTRLGRKGGNVDLSGLGTLLTGAGAAAASLYAIFKDVRKTNRRDSGSAGSHADEDGPEAVAELARRYLAEHHGNGDGPTPV